MHSRLIFLNTIFIVCFSTSLGAQVRAQLVSLNYQEKTFKYVLSDISEQYGLNFTYSSSMIDVNQSMNIKVSKMPLSKALEVVFEEAAVSSTSVGDQIVLKPAPTKKKFEPIGKLEKAMPKAIDQQTPLYHDPKEEARLAAFYKQKYGVVAPIKGKKAQSIPGGDRVITVDEERFESLTKQIHNTKSTTRLAQISLLPYVGTNALKSDKMTNRVSVNVLWGSNGGVDGVEVGGMMNTIRNDVKGVQIAGLANKVGKNVTGTQISGLFNTAKGGVDGVQASGLFNVAGEAKAIQASGLFNYCKGSFDGLQASSLFNVAGKGNGVQVAGLFNANTGSVRTQVSGLFNVAGDVTHAQISPFLNAGKKVRGFQFGLINVADTITGVPFGLLNIVKKGYNRIELASSEALFVQTSLKLGSRKLYNIFQIGMRWDKDLVPATSETKKFVSWGLGYGLGTAIPLSTKYLLNIEAMAIHINEKEGWTSEENLLTQLKLLFDISVGRRTDFFFGPTFNAMFSEKYNPDSNTYGSNIMPYNFYDQTTNLENVKMWVGFNSGFRF